MTEERRKALERGEGCLLEDRCPACGGEVTFGYGFAGGRLGGYTICLDCGQIVTKERTDPGECFEYPGPEQETT